MPKIEQRPSVQRTWEEPKEVKRKAPPHPTLTVVEEDLEAGVEEPARKKREELARKKSATIDHPARKQFKNWRCLWNPTKALNPNRCEPFAVMEVTIERGFGLEAADVATSDPYCKLELNGEQTGHVTKTVKNTLAPCWNETFEVEIYHPLSVFSITVYDKDFGTSLGEMDLLGLDDDFIGFLDIHIAKLPHNRKLHGWFALENKDFYADSVRARKSKAAKYGCGSLLLSLTVKVQRETSEVFALSLPRPHEGHGLPALDMVDMFDRYADLKQYATDVSAKIAFILELVEQYRPLIILSVLFIWNSSYIPAVCGFLASIAVAKLWIGALKKKRRQTGRGLCALARTSVVKALKEFFIMICIRNPIHSARNLGDSREPLLQQDANGEINGSPSISPRAMRCKEAAAALKAKDQNSSIQPMLQRVLTPKHQKAHDLGTALSNLQPFMSGEQKLDARNVQWFLTSATESIDELDALMDEDADLLLLCVGFLLFGIGSLQLHIWTGRALEIVLTAIIIFVAFRDSMPVRLFNAALLRCHLSSRRHRLRRRGEKVDDKLKFDNRSTRQLADIKDTSCFTRWAPICCKRRKLSQSHEEKKIRSGIPHFPVKRSYVEPTWCNGCGRFLWGISNQGYQCKWCQENFCKACSELAGCESGPRTCDAQITEEARREAANGSKEVDTKSVMSTTSSTSGTSRQSRWM